MIHLYVHTYVLRWPWEQCIVVELKMEHDTLAAVPYTGMGGLPYQHTCTRLASLWKQFLML